MNTAALITYLTNEFGTNEPIFINSIENQDAQRFLLQNSKRLISKKLILRHSRGVYYIPIMTEIGLARLSTPKVYEYKYLRNNAEYYGYYTNLNLMNLIGFSTQVPATVELVSSKVSKKTYFKMNGKIVATIFPSKVTISSNNVCVLQLLDAITLVIHYEYSASEIRQVCSDYIKRCLVPLDSFTQYLEYFPATTSEFIMQNNILSLLH